jgi:sulfite reductase alpha subunit-like flavoprotein
MIYVLYGTQTGNAQEISNDIYDLLIEKKYECIHSSLNKTLLNDSFNFISDNDLKLEKTFNISDENLLEFSEVNNSLQLTKQKFIIIICSTTGNGDAPETANIFWRKIKNPKLPKDLLKGIKYAVLGLGDTNYDKFCEMGKKIDKRFNDLGAERFIELHCADEAIGLEEAVELFKEKLLEYFNS